MLSEQDEYEFHSYKGEEAAATPNLVNAVSHVFSNSFGTNPQGRPYRLGPKTTKERLESTDHLFVANHQTEGLLAISTREFSVQLKGSLVGLTLSLYFPITEERK